MNDLNACELFTLSQNKNERKDINYYNGKQYLIAKNWKYIQL